MNHKIISTGMKITATFRNNGVHLQVLFIWKDVTSSQLPKYMKIMKQKEGWQDDTPHCYIIHFALSMSLKQIGSKVALAQTIHLFASAPGRIGQENSCFWLRRTHDIDISRFLGHGTLLRSIQATILVSKEHQNGTRLKDLTEFSYKSRGKVVKVWRKSIALLENVTSPRWSYAL